MVKAREAIDVHTASNQPATSSHGGNSARELLAYVESLRKRPDQPGCRPLPKTAIEVQQIKLLDDAVRGECVSYGIEISRHWLAKIEYQFFGWC